MTSNSLLSEAVCISIQGCKIHLRSPNVTGLIHHPYTPPAGFNAPQPGVFKASTVYFPTVADMRRREWKDKSAYTYGLHGTPTTYQLEERLCTLEGGLQCVLVPSGLAALALVALSVLQTGDEVLIPDNAYGPNKALAEAELRHFGISHQFYDPTDVHDLSRKIGPQTRLVWLEAPGSVSMEFPDLPEMVRRCKAQGVLTALDNTGGPVWRSALLTCWAMGREGRAVWRSTSAPTRSPNTPAAAGMC